MPIDPNNLTSTARLVFSDEFDSFRTWNGSNGWDTKWYYAPQEGAAGYNNELQWYVNAGYEPTKNVVPWTVADGVLEIKAQITDNEIKHLMQDYTFTSGMINSYNQFSQAYGYFEMRAQLPEGKGFWPAFWLLRKDGLVSSEIDILEMIGQEPTTLHNAMHSWETGSRATTSHEAVVPDMATGFHTYGLNWQPDKIEWYFDGKKLFEARTPADMHTPMYMIANLAVGGTWPGDPDEKTQFPSTMQIDHIRVYSEKPTQPSEQPTFQPPGMDPEKPAKAPGRESYVDEIGQVLTLGNIVLTIPCQHVGVVHDSVSHCRSAEHMTTGVPPIFDAPSLHLPSHFLCF
jgi:beta-glucanase (GH16 family)